MLRRLPIELASEKRLMVGLCFVKKTTNWAWEWGETYSRTLFCQKDYQLSLGVKRDLQSDFVLSKRLPIELGSEERLMVGLCFVKKTTNQAWEWGETYGQTLFSFFLFVTKVTNWACEQEENYSQTYFYYFNDQLDSPVKETDILYSLMARRKRALKKKKKNFCFKFNHWWPDNFTGKSQMVNTVHVNQNWCLSTASRILSKILPSLRRIEGS